MADKFITQIEVPADGGKTETYDIHDERVDNTINDINEIRNTFKSNNIQNGITNITGAIEQMADPAKNRKLKFPEADLYAKILDPTLTLDSETIGALADFSVSLGGNSSAQGKRTIAGGTTTVARGAYSTVFGDNCVSLKNGTDSLAHGYQTVVAAPASHSEGAFTVVMNQQYVEGIFESSSSGGGSSGSGSGEPNTTPTDTLQMDVRRGEAGHADGFNSYVSGFAAHTDGVSNVADGHISKASGRSNRAWSYLSKVDGYQSVVKPDDSDADATGEGSWANGKDIQITGAKYAYAGGESGRVIKTANNSFSYGKGLAAQASEQAVFGSYNMGDDVSAFIVGTGTSDTDRKTALRVLKSGQVLVTNPPTNPLGIVRLNEYNELNTKIIDNSTDITNLWSTLRDTNTNLQRVDANSYKTNGGLISGDVSIKGNVEVINAPEKETDVVRKKELDELAAKTFKSISLEGNVLTLTI